MKNLRFSLLFAFMLLVVASSSFAAKFKKIFDTSEETQVFSGYVAEDGNLYAGYNYLDTKIFKVYKYNGKTFEDSAMDSAQAKEFLDKKIPYSDTFMHDQIFDMRKIAQYYARETPMDIKPLTSEIFAFDDTVVSLRYVSELTYALIVAKNGKKENVLGEKYGLFLRQDYIYIDRDYKKIYFYGADFEKRIQGIFAYDIKNAQILPVAARKFKDDKKGDYFEPIRIPGTSKLLFIARESPLNRRHYVKSQHLCTVEIEEWKEEIEKGKK